MHVYYRWRMIKQSPGWCHVRSYKQDFLTSRKLKRERESKKIVSKFLFVISDEKYGHKPK